MTNDRVWLLQLIPLLSCYRYLKWLFNGCCPKKWACFDVPVSNTEIGKTSPQYVAATIGSISIDLDIDSKRRLLQDICWSAERSMQKCNHMMTWIHRDEIVAIGIWSEGASGDRIIVHTHHNDRTFTSLLMFQYLQHIVWATDHKVTSNPTVVFVTIVPDSKRSMSLNSRPMYSSQQQHFSMNR